MTSTQKSHENNVPIAAQRREDCAGNPALFIVSGYQHVTKKQGDAFNLVVYGIGSSFEDRRTAPRKARTFPSVGIITHLKEEK